MSGFASLPKMIGPRGAVDVAMFVIEDHDRTVVPAVNQLKRRSLAETLATKPISLLNLRDRAEGRA